MANQSHTPSWPSLYNPGIEILHIEHKQPAQPDGEYLYFASDIFRFTLYWTLIFYTPIFVLCGAYTFWNYNFPPSPRTFTLGSSYSMTSVSSTPTGNRRVADLPHVAKPPPKINERRSRLAFALLVVLTFLTTSVAAAVVGSAVLGFVATGLYKAAKFNMSTWIPFLLAILQVVVGLLSIWPQIIDII